ncbi:hypothetical protein Q5752_006288 [Cryptotrichosporon argae]
MSYPDQLSPAGLPVDNYTFPFWLTEPSPLANAQTTSELPEDPDLIIVGSGLSAAFVAYNVIKARPETRILVLEARELCSGASARNGGQVKTDPYMSYPSRKKKYGTEAANNLCKFELDHLKRYEAFLAEEPIPCSFHVTTAFDVAMTEEVAKTAKATHNERRADFPDDMAAYREVTDLEELERLSGVKGAHWGSTYRVASVWPYKLATGLFARAAEMAATGAGGGWVNIQTRTPVDRIEHTPNGWHAHTPRGAVAAHKLALCMNGYTSHLVPELANHIVPVRGTCSAMLPARPQPTDTPSACAFRPLFGSTAFKYGGAGGEYMISRQEGRKHYILGGGKQVYAHDLKAWYGNTDDSELLPGVEEHFNSYLPKHFKNWPDKTSNLDQIWTGILGYSSDLLPWIGEHPDRPPGLYISAGFHGHGMCRILGCSAALSDIILSGSTGAAADAELVKAGLPPQYLFTSERLAKKDNAILGTYMSAN